jgi:hypothetical protein
LVEVEIFFITFNFSHIKAIVCHAILYGFSIWNFLIITLFSSADIEDQNGMKVEIRFYSFVQSDTVVSHYFTD